MATTRSASGAKGTAKPRATATDAKRTPQPRTAAASAKPAPKPRAAATGKRAAGGAAQAAVSTEERQRMVREAAYYRAAQRGFAPGDEIADWLAAEADVDVKIAASKK